MMTKLTRNYDELAATYEQDNLLKDDAGNFIPVKLEATGLEEIEILDSQKEYTLPSFCENNFEELLAAHGTAKLYNNVNIRVDGWKAEKGSLKMVTSRTSYFASMVTNRCMDFQINGNPLLTVREVLESGPILHSLETSKLSNHLGFNGFVQTSDGYICLIERKGNVSIGANTYGPSVGASLKAKYALNAGQFTVDGLHKAIVSEIEDELSIPHEAIAEMQIIAAYRDLVEGGKPQLLFSAKTTMSKAEVERSFYKTVFAVESAAKKSDGTRAEKESEMIIDGNRLVWIPVGGINEVLILVDRIVYRGQEYKMMPSATASLLMWRKEKK